MPFDTALTRAAKLSLAVRYKRPSVVMLQRCTFRLLFVAASVAMRTACSTSISCASWRVNLPDTVPFARPVHSQQVTRATTPMRAAPPPRQCGSARRGAARLGSARLGSARLGSARLHSYTVRRLRLRVPPVDLRAAFAAGAAAGGCASPSIA